MFKDLKIFEYIYDNIEDPNAKDTEGNTPIFIAAQHCHLNLVQYLHEKQNVSLNQLRKGNVSLLHVAATASSNDKLGLLQYLVENKLELEASSDELGTPFMWAVTYNQLDSVEFFMNLNVNIRKQKQNQSIPPPIIMALNVQSPEIVQKLLSKDKDVILDTDAEGWSPLHFSSELGDLKSTKLFVENGADPNYTCQNKTALDLAHYNEKWEIVSYLRTLTKKEVDPNYKKPIERKIEDITEQNRADALLKKNEGNTQFGQKNYEEAIKCYTESLDLDFNNHIVLTNRAACYINLQRYQEALQDASKAKSINPDWIKAYFREGEAYFGLKQYGDSAASYWEGYRKNPSETACKSGFDHAIAVGRKYNKQKSEKEEAQNI